MKIITDERCTEYSTKGHPERPARVGKTIEKLRSQTDLPVTWIKPVPATDEPILRAHSREHIARIENPHDFDLDTPGYPNIASYARASVGAAFEALKCARAGETSFSLMRPPGHHATQDRAMGFCYFNNVAIAVLEGLATGIKRLAVFDFDVHHGNGTEAILMNRKGTAFFSVHQSPLFPGTGTSDVGDNCFNFPVSPSTSREEYRRALARALNAVKSFKPEVLAVSAGFDAFVGDRLADAPLEVEDYYWLGQEIRKLDLPTFSLLEGGYSALLPELILAYLKGIEGK